MRKFRDIAAFILVASFILTACGAPSTDATQGGYVSGDGQITVVPPDEREPAPTIKGETVDGKDVNIDDWRGDIVVINLWGSWCPPCREESPALDAVARETADEGVHFLGLSTRESPETTLAFIEKHDVSYPSLFDEGGRIQVAFADSLASQAVPTTWIIDADGNVAARAMTTLTESTLTDLIDNVRTENADG